MHPGIVGNVRLTTAMQCRLTKFSLYGWRSYLLFLAVLCPRRLKLPAVAPAVLLCCVATTVTRELAGGYRTAMHSRVTVVRGIRQNRTAHGLSSVAQPELCLGGRL